MSPAGVADQIAELQTLDRQALAERWVAVHGVPAPKSCQAPLLRCALAFHLQATGSAPARSATALRRAAAAPAAASLPPGSRLLREWNGQTHAVTVVAGGFDYQGKVWRSLSAIAYSITGTRWSGPLFFGLRS
jgi:hypothetical protein